MHKKIELTILSTVEKLSERTDYERRMLPRGVCDFPSVPRLKELVHHLNVAIFTDFFDRRRDQNSLRSFNIGVEIEKIFNILTDEISKSLRFCNYIDNFDSLSSADELALLFIKMIPEIKRMIYTDVQAIYDNDPAVDNYGEVILCYPVIKAMVHYRVAHALRGLGIPVLPRILTELAHASTGIDIHPGADIGEYFAIDHGSGVVIGETCVIGNHVTLYQGVTLGAKNFTLDNDGRPINLPRHPIIEDNVTIYSNSTVLGRITIGHDTLIGGNIWLTHSVPPGSKILQHNVMNESFSKDFGD